MRRVLRTPSVDLRSGAALSAGLNCGNEFMPQLPSHGKPQPAQRPTDEPHGLETGAGLVTISPRQPRRSRV